MHDQDQYVMLLSSLPAYRSLFGAQQTPLSRRKLDQRLRMLSPAHSLQLQQIEGTLNWDAIPLSLSNDRLVERFRGLLEAFADSSLYGLFVQRLEMRSIVAALQWRQQGAAAAPPGLWTPSPVRQHLARHWQEPDFQLQTRLGWVSEARQLLAADDVYGLEKLLLRQAWQALQRHPCRQRYGFEAVVVYVLKWDIIDRWSRYQAAAAARRFSQLLAAGMPANLLAGVPPTGAS